MALLRKSGFAPSGLPKGNKKARQSPGLFQMGRSESAWFVLLLFPNLTRLELQLVILAEYRIGEQIARFDDAD